jgi:hypothetical protein
MKFVCPESQKRVPLKCGSIDSGSAMESLGALPAPSAVAVGVPPFGKGVPVCCAHPGVVHVAATSSHNTASSALAILRIDFRLRFPTSPTVQSTSMLLVSKKTLQLRSQLERQVPLPLAFSTQESLVKGVASSATRRTYRVCRLLSAVCEKIATLKKSLCQTEASNLSEVQGGYTNGQQELSWSQVPSDKRCRYR